MPIKNYPAIPRSIWMLGFVSLFMDVSSELIHGLLPVFMVSSLGASAFAVGVVEGIAEATALIVKVFSGVLSDYLGKRKALAVIGYGLGALSKPLFALALTVNWVLAARFMDRIGKGIRGAPRDALVADLAPPEIRGAAFGLRQSLDTVGAFVGPLLGVALMLFWAGDFRTVFWYAVIPAVIAVLLLVFGVEEPGKGTAPRKAAAPVEWNTLAELSGAYWFVVAAGAVFTLARFSEAFLILRAQQQGLPDSYAPLVLVVMNIVYAVSAYPLGKLADRMSHLALLSAGLIVLIAADLILAQTQGLDHGRRYGPGAFARHGVRLFQSGERHRDARRQRARGSALGSARPGHDLLCRRPVLSRRPADAGPAKQALTRGLTRLDARRSAIQW